jgi:hypothetical protein
VHGVRSSKIGQTLSVWQNHQPDKCWLSEDKKVPNIDIDARLEIRIVLANGEERGLIDSECEKLVSFCCQEKNSAVS